MNTLEIIALCAAGALFLTLCIVGIVRIARQRAVRAEEMTREVDPVNIKKGVRYTEDATVVTKAGEMNVTYERKDVLLKENQTQVSDPKGELKPGKYVVLSTTGENQTFNIRIGNYVKEYKHNQKIVIPAGTEVTCVSGTVILR